jgi:hypothetical protein
MLPSVVNCFQEDKLAASVAKLDAVVKFSLLLAILSNFNATSITYLFVVCVCVCV